jgi:hypothetical protein
MMARMNGALAGPRLGGAASRMATAAGGGGDRNSKRSWRFRGRGGGGLVLERWRTGGIWRTRWSGRRPWWWRRTSRWTRRSRRLARLCRVTPTTRRNAALPTACVKYPRRRIRQSWGRRTRQDRGQPSSIPELGLRRVSFLVNGRRGKRSIRSSASASAGGPLSLASSCRRQGFFFVNYQARAVTIHPPASRSCERSTPLRLPRSNGDPDP